MPLLTKINERANVIFSSENIGSLDRATILQFDNLISLAKHLEILQTPTEEAFLKQWPDSVLGAVLEAIKRGVSADTPTPICFSWAPDYDFNVRIWDAHSTDVSIRGMTVMLRSRYPETA